MVDESEKWDAFLDAWQEVIERDKALINWADEVLKFVKPKEKAQQFKNRLEEINGKD